jgi:hypothetical protein
VIVGHHLWSKAGGGELVNAYAVKVLLDSGHQVAIATTFGFEEEKYEEWFNLDLGNVKTYKLLPRAMPFFGVYQRLGFFVPLLGPLKRDAGHRVR